MLSIDGSTAVAAGIVRPRRTRRTTRLVVGGALLAVTSAALVGCGGSTPAPAPVVTAAVASVPVAPITSAAAIVPIAVQTTSATDAWLLTVHPVLLRLNADSQSIDTAANDGNPPGAACDSLRTDVAAFSSATPAPRAAVRAIVAQALSAYNTAVASCTAGDVGGTTTNLSQASTDLQAIPS